MVFSTDHPTRYRSWIGYLWLLCVLAGMAGAGLAATISPEIGVLLVLLSSVVLHIGWFLLIALDVRELGDTLDGGVGNWLYPFSVLLGLLGVLLYLWDRERNLPARRRSSDPHPA